MPIASPEVYAQMLDRAKAGKFAYPAINCTSSQTIVAAIRGFAEAQSDGIVQVSWGGAEFASGQTVKDMVAGAKWLEDLGCDYIIHHIGYDERRGLAAAGHRMPSPLDQLRQVVNAVNIPVQAVGGLTLEQAIQCPQYGAPLVVLGAPLTIDADTFKTATGDLETSLRLICQAIHTQKITP
jgi:3-hexulose-6-phosphate synthase/6-phospho-3-hexuloisomerase